MSNTPEENAKIETAKADFVAYATDFENKYGYAIGFEVTPAITPEGYIKLENKMKLVKLDPENTAITPPDGNNETEETSASDSSERSEGEAA